MPYAAKRVVRIYLPFAGAIALSLLLRRCFDHGPVAAASDWLNRGTWDGAVTPGRLALTFAMTGTYVGLDNPMWSLVHELRLSLVFPLLVAASRRHWPLTLLSTAVLGGGCIAATALVSPDGFAATLLRTCSYAGLFVIGITIAMHSRLLRRWMAARISAIRLAAWIAALAILSFAPADTGQVGGLPDYALMLADGAAAGAVIVLSLVEGQAMTLLLGRVPLFLGRVSYSLYLVHVPVIAAAVEGLPVSWPLILKVFVGVTAAFPVAFAFHLGVERPAAVLSRRMGGTLGGRRDRRPAPSPVVTGPTRRW